MDKIFVALGSLVGIILTYWYFLAKPEAKAVQVKQHQIDILVDGGYQPNHIQIPLNQTTTLNFIRKDPSSCLEEILIPDFHIQTFLPLNQTTPLTITPHQKGTFEISCGMHMFHGKLEVI